MKISDYINNQSALVKRQISQNHKLVQDIILPITKNSSKDKSTTLYETANPKKNITEILKDENTLFLDLYTKTKKLYPTKVEETFKDLILQYQNNDYKIPDLSDKKNLFNQNPLLLVGRDLDQFYMYNEKVKNNNKKIKTKLSRKHINFIKKEMLFMEKIINKNNEINKKKNNLTNNNNNEEDEDNIDYKTEKINYFMVDSVWDKIKEQKLKMENLKKMEKMKKNRIKTLEKSSKTLKIKKEKVKKKLNKSSDNKKFIYSYNTFNKNSNNNNKNNNNGKNSKDSINLKSVNSIGTIKNIPSIDTIKTNSTYFTFQNKNSKSISPIKKLKNNLLNIKLINENEESNKLQKEIDEIKNTLSNRNLIEKNIIIENTPRRKSSKLKTISSKSNNNSVIKKVFPSLSLKNSFPLLTNNNEKRSKEKQQEENISKKNNNDENFKNKLNSLKLFDLIKKRTLPFLTLNKLLKEKDPSRFIEIISKIDLKMFNRKEIEKLMRAYCEKILGYNEKEIERIININRNDENIYRIIERVIRKTKKGSLKYFGTYDLRKTLDTVNNTIYDLKKKFIYGKTDYNYES